MMTQAQTMVLAKVKAEVERLGEDAVANLLAAIEADGVRSEQMEAVEDVVRARWAETVQSVLVMIMAGLPKVETKPNGRLQFSPTPRHGASSRPPSAPSCTPGGRGPSSKRKPRCCGSG